MSTKTVRRAWAVVAAVVALIVALPLMAQEDNRSVEDALRNLHRSQAKAADWEAFQPGSSVTYLRVGRSRSVGAYREKVTQVMTSRTPTQLRFDMILESGERNPWLPSDVEAPRLAAANAEKVGEEDVYIGGKKFHAVIYQFTHDEPGRFGRSFESTFWLAPGVPDGVVRHHEKVILDPTLTSETDMKVTDLNVQLKAGTKTVLGYCFETEEGTRGGKFNRGRMCKSKEVPGAVLTAEQSEMEGAVEKAHVTQTVESFTVVR